MVPFTPASAPALFEAPAEAPPVRERRIRLRRRSELPCGGRSEVVRVRAGEGPKYTKFDVNVAREKLKFEISGI